MIFGLRTRRQSGRFVCGNAEPVHAGIDVERSTAAPILSGDEGVPLREFGRAVDHGLRVQFGERFGGLRRKPVEYVDCGFARTRAHPPCLGDVGNEEGLAAGLYELGRDRLKTQPVGIGFDHGGAFDGEKLARERAPVRLDRIEIDGESPAGLRHAR